MFVGFVVFVYAISIFKINCECRSLPRRISAKDKLSLITADWCTKLTEDVTRKVYIHPSVTLKDFQSGGTGVYATNKIDADTVLLSIPVECCLFSATAKYHNISIDGYHSSSEETDIINQILDDSPLIGLSFYLTQLRLIHFAKEKINIDLDWHPFASYFETLPLTIDEWPNLPLLWDSVAFSKTLTKKIASDINSNYNGNMIDIEKDNKTFWYSDLIKHTGAFEKVSLFKEKIEKHWKRGQMLQILIKQAKLLNITMDTDLELQQFVLQQFLWGYSMIGSRLWAVWVPNSFQLGLVL